MDDIWSRGKGTPWARLRRDESTISMLVAILSSDAAIMEHIAQLDPRPVGSATAGLLFGCRLKASRQPAILKLNAGTLERQWLIGLQSESGLTPEVFASGDRVGDIDLGWALIEHLTHLPNEGMGSPEWYESILDAATRWHKSGLRKSIPTLQVIDEGWMSRWLQAALKAGAPNEVRELSVRLPTDWRFVTETAELVPSHGDLHFHNSGSRTGDPEDGLALFDPMPRSAPWPFDAAYCETLTVRDHTADNHPLVHRAADLRMRHGLGTPSEDAIHRLSALFCGWLSVMWYVNFASDWHDFGSHHRISSDLDRALSA